MRATQTLGRLELQVGLRLTWLRDMAAAALAMRPPKQIDLAFVCVDAANTWTEFSRALIVSAVQGSQTTRGVLSRAAPPHLGRVPESIDAVLRQRNPRLLPMPPGGWPRREEPKWGSKDVLLAAATTLGISNLASVDAALSAGSRVLDDLPVVRNYYSHRNFGTERAVWNCLYQRGFPRGPHPDWYLHQTYGAIRQPLVNDWLDDLQLIVSLACQ